MKVIYQGEHTAVDVPLPFGGVVTCKRGEPVQVPDTLGQKLLQQPKNWTKKGRK